MKLWFAGHACLLLEGGWGRIAFDPFSPSIGYEPLAVEADLVCVSHSNPRWHSHIESVAGDPLLFEGLHRLNAPLDWRGLRLEAFEVLEGDPPRDRCAMIRVSGLTSGASSPSQSKPSAMGRSVTVLHMGDCARRPDAAMFEALGAVDVLLAPVGGSPTIALDDLIDFVGALRPRIVVPMHYAVPGLAMQLQPRRDFEALWRERWGDSTIQRPERAFCDLTPLTQAQAQTQDEGHGNEASALLLLEPARLPFRRA